MTLIPKNSLPPKNPKRTGSLTYRRSAPFCVGRSWNYSLQHWCCSPTWDTSSVWIAYNTSGPPPSWSTDGGRKVGKRLDGNKQIYICKYYTTYICHIAAKRTQKNKKENKQPKENKEKKADKHTNVEYPSLWSWSTVRETEWMQGAIEL